MNCFLDMRAAALLWSEVIQHAFQQFPFPLLILLILLAHSRQLAASKMRMIPASNVSFRKRS